MRGRTPLRVAVALLLLLVFASAASAQSDVQVARATAARDSGRTAEAIRSFEKLRAERPNDPTILRLLASSYAAAKRFADAAQALDRARTLAPRDRDIMLAQARVALWSGHPAEARAIAREIGRIDPANLELPALLKAIGAERQQNHAVITIVQQVSDVRLPQSRRTWIDTGITFDEPLDNSTHVTAEADREDRETAVDTSVSLGLAHRLGATASFYGAATLTPNADFRAKYVLRAGGEARLRRWLSITLDARYARYTSNHIEALEPGLRLSTNDQRFSISAHAISLWDDRGTRRTGVSGRGEVQVRGGIGLFAGAASFPDTEGGVTRRVHAAFAGVDVPLSGRLDLRLTGEHERRVQSYRRDGVTLALRWRL